MNRPSAKKDSNYHHGDLRNALVSATIKLIAERGAENFAMIDAARQAGVSSAAPYRHFKDKEELLEAVTDTGFNNLFTQVSEAASQHPRGTIQRIFAIGEKYLEFVIENASLFELMWAERGAKAMSQPYWHPDAPNNGFWVLVNAVSDWCDALHITGIDPIEVSVQLWATALGIASLTINKQLSRILPEAQAKDMLIDSSRSFLEGLRLTQEDKL